MPIRGVSGRVQGFVYLGRGDPAFLTTWNPSLNAKLLRFRYPPMHVCSAKTGTFAGFGWRKL